MKNRNTRIWSSVQRKIVRDIIQNNLKKEERTPLINLDEILKEYQQMLQETDLSED